MLPEAEMKKTENSSLSLFTYEMSGMSGNGIDDKLVSIHDSDY